METIRSLIRPAKEWGTPAMVTKNGLVIMYSRGSDLIHDGETLYADNILDVAKAWDGTGSFKAKLAECYDRECALMARLPDHPMKQGMVAMWQQCQRCAAAETEEHLRGVVERYRRDPLATTYWLVNLARASENKRWQKGG